MRTQKRGGRQRINPMQAGPVQESVGKKNREKGVLTRNLLALAGIGSSSKVTADLFDPAWQPFNGSQLEHNEVEVKRMMMMMMMMMEMCGS